jgi:3-oxoacyl-[acyl-carrier protein] reductase
MGKLSGKAAIVTGGARGLGRVFALRLASLGADVGIIDLNLRSFEEFEREKSGMTADTVIDELRNLGVKAHGVEADVTDFEQVRRAVDEIAARLGDIEILVANAGGGIGGVKENAASSMNMNQFHAVVERNFFGTVYAVTAVAPMMKKLRRGKIVTMASLAGLRSDEGGTYAHYGSSKAAIIMYTKYLAQELGPYNINANVMAPGYIATGRLMDKYEQAGVENFTKHIALGRLGTPEDCANVLEFLTTDLSDYITGAVIDVGGGVNRF